MFHFGKTCSAIIIREVNDWAHNLMIIKVDVAWKLLSVFRCKAVISRAYTICRWFMFGKYHKGSIYFKESLTELSKCLQRWKNKMYMFLGNEDCKPFLYLWTYYIASIYNTSDGSGTRNMPKYQFVDLKRHVQFFHGTSNNQNPCSMYQIHH